jgi:hypothetical protein
VRGRVVGKLGRLVRLLWGRSSLITVRKDWLGNRSESFHLSSGRTGISDSRGSSSITGRLKSGLPKHLRQAARWPSRQYWGTQSVVSSWRRLRWADREHGIY